MSRRHVYRLGVRAAGYVAAHGRTWSDGGDVIVADTENTPPGVARTLTRHFGRPQTIDRGEVAYWRIDGEVRS